MRISFHDTLLKLTAVFVIFILLATKAVYGQAPLANFTASPQSGCSPLVVTFQDLSTGNPTTWSWDFGNGNTSSLQNPTAAYFNPGQYTIRLTVTNATGSNTLTRTQYITVNESPTVDFNTNITAGCYPLPVQFTDLSTAGSGNTNVSWEWNFGNGLISTSQNPSTTYTSSGLFTVTLKVTNDKGCSKTVSKTNYISVTTGVNADFSPTQQTVCRPPANITFANNTTGPGVLSYFWMFGDGNTTTLQNPTHTYASAGNFTVTLIATSSSGCTDTIQKPVSISTINMSFTGPDNICVNEVANFNNNTGTNPLSAFWTFGDGGTSTAINATYSYATAGTYTIRVYYDFGYCTDSATNDITVNPLPVPDFTSATTVICQPPLTVNFQNLSTGAVSWQWNFGDGSPISTAQNPTHTYTNYGNYTVTLIATSSSGCIDTIIKPDFIKIQRAQITIPLLPARGCIPFTISPVANINSLDNVLTYVWNFGDGNTSTMQNPTHTYVAQGTYTVSLIITTSSGCTDTFTINQAVRVGSKPVADFSAAPTTQCAYQGVQFTDLSVPADEWTWDFGDGGGSNAQNPGHTYTTPGVYTVTLIAYNNGCPDTAIKLNYVSVLPPVSQFTSAANCSNRTEFQFTDQSMGPLTWLWDFGDGSPTSGLQNPVHIFPAFGTYNVTLTVTNGGCSHTSTRIIKVIDENPDFIVNQTTVCKSSMLNFTVTNIAPANISMYEMYFGDGGYYNGISPNITWLYNTPGTFTVTLIITDLNGCKDTVTKTNYIRINGPGANFSQTNTTGCAGLTTTFNDLSVTDGINSIVNWQWDFGDGTIQNFSSPPFVHTYNTPGTYSVKLKITDAAGCTDSLIKTNLIVATDPIPNFISPDTFVCPGANVRFNNTSSAINFTSTWDFGDGNTSNANSPTHNYTITGIYTVKLNIIDQFGCADSIIRTMYVFVDSPIASFNVSDSVSACTPMQVQFTNTSHYYSSILWDFGPGGTSTDNTPIHYYNSPGTYNVKLVVTSPGGCKDSTFRTITVYDTAGVRIDYLPYNGCKPLRVDFNAVSTVPFTYLWDFGDGYSQTTSTTSITHIYDKFGRFLPKMIIVDPTGCLIPVIGFDTVYVIGATAKFNFDNNIFCDQGTVNFVDSTTFNDPVTVYSWDFGDGGSSNQQNPAYNYSMPGLYNVTLAVQTQNGCTDTISIPNAIKIVESPLIGIGGDTAICLNGSISHQGLFIRPDTSSVIWSWTFPNGNNSNLQNPIDQTYNNSGSFTVTAIATNSSGCKDTTTQNIRVHALPTVLLPGSMTIQNGFTATIPATYSSGVVNWNWSPATGLSCTNCPQPEAGPKFKTNYSVLITDSNGCVNFGSIEVNVICKNSNLFIPNTFSPNGDGSNDQFYPRGMGLDRVKMMRIFNRWGEVVFEKRDFPINDPTSGWDGTYKGRKPHADVYIYQVEVFCENGEIIALNGNIALIL